MTKTFCSTTYRIAKVCHEVNRAYCQSIGDFTQPSWSDAPEWQRESAYAGVQFRMDNPSASAEDLHDSWMRHKIADGWYYGAKKNPELKQHPCLVPYDELPREQQTKDHLFAAVISAMLR